MRHPWRFYPASTGQPTAASKGGSNPNPRSWQRLAAKPNFQLYSPLIQRIFQGNQ